MRLRWIGRQLKRVAVGFVSTAIAYTLVSAAATFMPVSAQEPLPSLPAAPALFTAQDPGDQMPPEPEEFPEGQFCQHPTPETPNPEHPCACERHCMEGSDGKPFATHDPQCKQWCHEHKDKCRCPVTGCE